MEGQLFNIAAKIGTPLSIAAIIVIALYLLYKAILRLPIFAQLTGDKTFIIVDSIIKKIFILALVALMLGVCAYMYSQYLLSHDGANGKSEHDLRVVDVSSASEEAPVGFTPKSIGPVKSGNLSLEDLKDNSRQGSGFPTADIKLRNAGANTIFIKRLTVQVDKAEIDITPMLNAGVEMDSANNMNIVITNSGWGDAREVLLQPVVGKLCDYLSPEICQTPWQGEIKESITIPIPKSAIKLGRLGGLQSVTLKPSQRVEEGNFQVGMKGTTVDDAGIALIDYKDQRGTPHQEKLHWMWGFEEELWVTNQGFIILKSPVQAEVVHASETYNILLETKDAPYEQSYTISHSIEPNQLERFQVTIAGEKSMFFTVRFRLYFDENSTLETPSINLHVLNPQPGGVEQYSRSKHVLAPRGNEYDGR